MILALYRRHRAHRPTIEVETTEGARSIERAGFGLHLVLEELLSEYAKSLDKPESATVWKSLELYFEHATGLPVEMNQSFVVFARNLLRLWVLNTLLQSPPFLKRSKSSDEYVPPPWDYRGRSSVVMVHLVARSYGWRLDEIVEMDPEMGFALVNEILVEQQLDQEWEYGLSEVSRVYSEATKRSHFRPLPRPLWMEKTIADLTTQIPKVLMPVGNVINVAPKPK